MKVEVKEDVEEKTKRGAYCAVRNEGGNQKGATMLCLLKRKMETKFLIERLSFYTATVCVCRYLCVFGDLGFCRSLAENSNLTLSTKLGSKLRFHPSTACDTKPVSILWGKPA